MSSRLREQPPVSTLGSGSRRVRLRTLDPRLRVAPGGFPNEMTGRDAPRVRSRLPHTRSFPVEHRGPSNCGPVRPGRLGCPCRPRPRGTVANDKREVETCQLGMLDAAQTVSLESAGQRPEWGSPERVTGNDVGRQAGSTRASPRRRSETVAPATRSGCGPISRTSTRSPSAVRQRTSWS